MVKNVRKWSLILSSGVVLLVVLACNATVTVLNPTPTPVLPAPVSDLPTPTVVTTSASSLSQQVTLVTVPFNENNPGGDFPTYTLTAQVPQLTGSDDPRVQAFNRRLNDLIMKEVDMWRQNFQQMPVTPNSNGSSLDVKYTLISQIGELWSFKFDFLFYSDGAAHPGSYSITVNYELGQSRELALGDLFLVSSNYLEVIATYCKTELGKQPFFDPVFATGADPTVENYRNWNISPDGLRITFDDYQVAPHAAGPQTVTVPWNELNGLIDPQGPLPGIVQ
jgi:hypothetical protein